MWERRYGFPVPNRDPHGERLYPADQVDKLRVISRLLDRGLRPGQLVKVPLSDLLERSESHATTGAVASESADSTLVPLMEEAIELLKVYDGAGLRAQLSRVLQRLGLQRFVIEFAAPLTERVGEAWSRGEIAIGQEHLYTEQIGHLLRQGIGAIYPEAQEPSVMLTTLPGEAHQLGLLMAQACLATEGARCVSLGAQTPAWDIVGAARAQKINVVGLSFSEALKLNAAYRMLEDLRARLPTPIEIWAGGRLWTRARRPVPGVRFITSLTQIPRVIAEQRIQRARNAPGS